MRLGFYYHVPINQKEENIIFPGYLGVFIDALANEVEHLTLFLHQANTHEEKELDYIIKATNVTWINLGIRTPAWHRSFFHGKSLNRFQQQLQQCDYLLVRAPTPLGPYFYKYIDRKKIVFMIVGDNKHGAQNFKINNLRDYVITIYLRINDYLFDLQIKKTKVLVNSGSLYNRYKEIALSIYRIKTTTLTASDFFERIDTCIGDKIELLYTGRIDKAKGLFELIEATSLLIKTGYQCKLNIVGWEIKEGAVVETQLKNYAEKLGISTDVIFHGKKQVGKELNQMYRKADIYTIPSYHEGFPRTIWEAMANGLPVITTPVGGIPDELTNEVNALFVSPKSSISIKEGVERIIKDQSLRKKLISNGREMARINTLETQTKKVVELIRSNC